MSAVEENAKKGRLEGLEALRDTLARNVDSCDSLRDLAALSHRLVDVLQQIDELTPKEATGDAIDEIAQRRAARRPAGATGPSRAKRPS